jgi:putative flavoprotein involved in K+ transport
MNSPLPRDACRTGLYFLGLSWQHTRGSALLGWVAADAQFIAEQIAANDESTEVTTTGETPAPTSERI